MSLTPAIISLHFSVCLLTDLKARLRAVVSVNRELILLYWDIGKIIVESQPTKGYGKPMVARLADDLQKDFPHAAKSVAQRHGMTDYKRPAESAARLVEFNSTFVVSSPSRVAVKVILPGFIVERMATRLMPHSVSSQRLLTEFIFPLL